MGISSSRLQKGLINAAGMTLLHYMVCTPSSPTFRRFDKPSVIDIGVLARDAMRQKSRRDHKTINVCF
jgi:hypothetical protein